jgi:putative lipoprotein
MQNLDRRQLVKSLALALCLTVLPHGARAAQARVSGTVSYRERIALPDNATLTVQLVELIEEAAAGRIVGEQVISPAGQVPVPFDIAYDPASLEDGTRLGLTARIAAEGAMLFESKRTVAVDPASADDLELMLERAWKRSPGSMASLARRRR